MVKNYLTKKCALNQGEKKLYFEEDEFFLKDKKVIAAKLCYYFETVCYVCNALPLHRQPLEFKNICSFKNFKNCQLRESHPFHCGAKCIELSTMICNFAILISCTNTILNSRPLFSWWWQEITGLFRLIRYSFAWSDTLKRDLEKGSGTTALFRLFNINLLIMFVPR